MKKTAFRRHDWNPYCGRGPVDQRETRRTIVSIAPPVAHFKPAALGCPVIGGEIAARNAAWVLFPMHYMMYKDTAGYWRWRFVAANNRIIAVSSESYHNEKDCMWSIALVKGSSAAPVYKE